LVYTTLIYNRLSVLLRENPAMQLPIRAHHICQLSIINCQLKDCPCNHSETFRSLAIYLFDL